MGPLDMYSELYQADWVRQARMINNYTIKRFESVFLTYCFDFLYRAYPSSTQQTDLNTSMEHTLRTINFQKA